MVKEQKFTSPNDVLGFMKELFKDVLQESLEAEMDCHLGYDKYDVSDQIKQLYDVDISAEMVSNITNRILPLVTDWQTILSKNKNWSILLNQFLKL